MKKIALSSLKNFLKSALLLTASSFFLFTSCITQNPDVDEKDTPEQGTEQGGNTDTDTDTDTDADTDTGKEDDDPSSDDSEDQPLYTPVDDSSLEDMSAIQFTKIMGNGINLGNTMEATSGAGWPGLHASDPTLYETMWGQPVTTKEMFVAMKAAGFDSVRIPIGWTHTMDWSRNDFTISTKYLDRIETIVNYALDAGLFVMINEHWDRDWWCLFSHDEELAWKIYESIWTQVGNRFKDYDYRLIFEGGNEEHGESLNHTLVCDSSIYVENPSSPEQIEYHGTIDDRLEGINYPNKGTLSEDELYTMVGRINQKFVDIIRSQGSKNEKRFLLIPGFTTNIDSTCDDRYKMPEDPSNSVQKLIVSVHYYNPAPYSLTGDPDNSWGFADTWGTTEEITTQNAEFYKMTKFTQAGYGVIIGEYAVAQKQLNNNTFVRKNNDVQWITNVLDNCDTYSFCPFLWDCNLYFKKNNVTTLGFQDSDIQNLYKNRNYEAEKNGTSTGEKIEYTPPVTVYKNASAELTPNSSEEGIEITINLPEPVIVQAGHKIEFSFERPEISNDWSGHVLKFFNSSNNLIHNAEPSWCTATAYPSKNKGPVNIRFIPENTVTISSMYLYINEKIPAAGTFKITDLLITVQ